MIASSFLERRNKLLRLFYLATPLFFLWDSVAEESFRISALSNQPLWRTLYYLACFLAGLLAIRRPQLAAITGLIESSVNILLLVLSVMLPYYAYVQAVAADAEAGMSPPGFGLPELSNFILSGIVLVISFYGNPLISARHRSRFFN